VVLGGVDVGPAARGWDRTAARNGTPVGYGSVVGRATGV
jgi:hypothetical protein